MAENMSNLRPDLDAAKDAADDYIDACYAKWLMEQPEAGITSGDVLVQRMETQWGFDRFINYFLGLQ